MKRLFRSEPLLSSALIVIVMLLTYASLIPQLGFYRDDWYLIWAGQARGFKGIVDLFQSDRPLDGWVYGLEYLMLGLRPLYWQLWVLFLRILGALGFLWLARLLWPGRRMETLLMALLFAVYPGFVQQWNAATYPNLLLAVAASLFSLALSLRSLRKGRPVYAFLSALLAGLLTLFYLGIFEAMIGLEAVRLLLALYVVHPAADYDLRRAALRALRAVWPSILAGVGFLIWRLFIFQSTRHATNLNVLLGKYAAIPWRTPLTILIETSKDVIETGLLAWFVPFYQFTSRGNYTDLGLSLLIVAAVLGLILWYLRRASRQGWVDWESQSDSDPHLHFLLLGILVLLLVMLPINIAGRNVLFSDQWDRYTAHASLGAVLALGGFLFFSLRGVSRRVAFIVLIVSGVVTHVHSAAWYRDFWSAQRAYWWQMTWRAPRLKENTMLFSVLPNISFAEGYEIYSPANIIYYPGSEPRIGANVLNAQTAARIRKGDVLINNDRGIALENHYENTLISVVPTSKSCLHLLNAGKVELPGFLNDSLVMDVAAYSHLDRVDLSASPAIPPTPIFGSEPPHGWCYYYEEMDLARQAGDWQRAAAYADQAAGLGLTPDDLSEWMPVLEAYAVTGRVKDARHAAAILRSDSQIRQFLCFELQKGPAYPAPYDVDQINQYLCGSD